MAAQSTPLRSLSESPPRRIPLDLRDLFTARELQEIAGRLRVGLLDSTLAEIAASPDARNWCQIIQNGGLSDVNCLECPAIARLMTPRAGYLVWTKCLNGLERPLVPLLCNEQAIGWVTARPFVASKIDPLIKSINDKTLRNQVELLKVPTPRHFIEHSISRALGELAPQCVERRRKAIMEKARQAILDAKDVETVHAGLFGAIQDLYGDLKAVHLYEEHKDLNGECYRLIKSEGTDYRDDDYRLPRHKTHLGLAIARARPHYEPRLRKDDPDFVHTAPCTRPKSVFTIPLRLGVQAAPAALQLQSNQEDFFRLEIDREMVIQLAVLAASVASKLALRKELAAANRRAETTNTWNDFVVDILLDNTWSRFEILRNKQKVYSQFVEQLRAMAGTECIGTSVRLINRLTDIIGFVAASGSGFNAERMQKQYSSRLKGAAHKALLAGHLYYPDVKRENDYYKLIPETRSLWIESFRIHGETLGIVAVDWKVTDGCSQAMHDRFCSLIAQFERVLEVLADRQELVVADLQKPVADIADLDEAALSLVSDLKVLFEARACSLFLDRHNQRILSLQATTDPGHGDDSYAFGKGITGWVSEHKKSVRIRHTGDPEELRAIQELHGISDELKHANNYQENIDYGSARKLSFLAAPLVARGRVLGVIRLTVKNNAEKEFTHQDETFLQEIANKLARSLDVRWLAEDTDRQLREIEREADWREQLRLAAGLTEVCQVLSDQFMHRTRARGAYLLVSDREEALGATVASGILKMLLTLPVCPPLPLGNTSSPSIWDDPSWEPLCEALKEHLSDLAWEMVQSAVSIAIPMTGAHARLVLVWQSPKQMGMAFDREVADLTESLETALRQARIQKQLENTNEELQLLQELAITCGSERSLNAICAKILSVALSEVRLERGTIRLHRPENDWVLHTPTDRTDDEVPPVISTNSGLRRCLTSEEPFVIKSRNEEWQRYLESLGNGARRRYLELFSYLVVVPLHVERLCLGAIILESTAHSAVSQRSLDFLRTLGRYASVAIRSVQLHEKELQVRPIEMVGAMMGGFSHVMRNKVNNAMAAVGLLETEKLPPDERKLWFTRVKMDLGRIENVCTDLAHFSGVGDTINARVSVNELFEQVWGDMADRLKVNVVKHLRLDPSQPRILGNVAQIQVAIRMLMQNALEAMPDGGRLFYWTSVRGGHVSIRVGDTGKGMDKHTKERCLEPFYTTKTKGTGLGLAVVVTIARQHHAELSVVSKQGKGTLWKLRFPKAGD